MISEDELDIKEIIQWTVVFLSSNHSSAVLLVVVQRTLLIGQSVSERLWTLSVQLRYVHIVFLP